MLFLQNTGLTICDCRDFYGFLLLKKHCLWVWKFQTCLWSLTWKVRFFKVAQEKIGKSDKQFTQIVGAEKQLITRDSSTTKVYLCVNQRRLLSSSLFSGTFFEHTPGKFQSYSDNKCFIFHLTVFFFDQFRFQSLSVLLITVPLISLEVFLFISDVNLYREIYSFLKILSCTTIIIIWVTAFSWKRKIETTNSYWEQSRRINLAIWTWLVNKFKYYQT